MESPLTDLAYAAGVIDSDGYIGVHRSTYAMRVRGDATQPIYAARVQVKQVEPQAVDLLHMLFGGHRYGGKASTANGRPMLVWSVHSAAVGPVLSAVLPYLRIKRQQAVNALDVVRLSAMPKRFAVPDVIDGEPMLTMAEVARRLGKRYDVVLQAVRKGSVPHVRTGPRKVLIPESYLATWSVRGTSPRRSADVSDQLEACCMRAKALNHAT